MIDARQEELWLNDDGTCPELFPEDSIDDVEQALINSNVTLVSYGKSNNNTTSRKETNGRSPKHAKSSRRRKH